ncbi:unnamed protein product [Schistocephalus solidus]|uniref:C2H2-type domain-containing protein n=1 Tax=Schistocephalus solidus TaxID=70667 RepID=A0A183SRU6_SCHSO|nr:unnamed protein product [Schistocephalus solidus]
MQDPGHRSAEKNRPLQHLRAVETTATALERPPCEDGRRTTTKTTLLRRCRDGFSSTRGSSTMLQEHFDDFPEVTADRPGKLEEFARNRPAWWRTVNTRTAIYEDYWITAAKAKRAARKSPASRTHTANAQALPACPRRQRTFARESACSNAMQQQFDKSNFLRQRQPTLLRSPLTVTPGTNSLVPIIIATKCQYSSPVSSSTVTTTTTSNVGSVLNCPHCDRTFTSHIGRVGHLRIHSTETASSSPATHGDEQHLAHVSGHLRQPAASTTTTTAPSTSDGDSVLTCPNCDCTLTSHIGLVGHLRIHHTEPSELVPGAPAYTSRTGLNCLHCPRPFTHRIGLFRPVGLH